MGCCRCNASKLFIKLSVEKNGWSLREWGLVLINSIVTPVSLIRIRDSINLIAIGIWKNQAF